MSKRTLKIFPALAARQLRELRKKLSVFVDAPVQTELALEYFSEKADAWVADVKETLNSIFEDERIIAVCLRHLNSPRSQLDELQSALLTLRGGGDTKLHERALVRTNNLKRIGKELESLEGQLVFFSPPERSQTKEESAAEAQERIDQFNNGLRKPAGAIDPATRALAPQGVPQSNQPKDSIRAAKPLTPIAQTEASEKPEPHTEGAQMIDPRRVFVVYGRNIAAYKAMVSFLSMLDLKVWNFDELSAECGGSEFVGTIIEKGMKSSAAVIALFTPDEVTALHPDLRFAHDRPTDKLRWQARPNVIFEAGLALGMDAKKTIIVTLGADVALFSDADGRHIVRLSNSREARNRLRLKLSAAKCAVDMKTDSWADPALAGDFESCIKASAGPMDAIRSAFEDDNKPGTQ